MRNKVEDSGSILLTKIQKKQCMQKMLDEDFPYGIVIPTMICNILLSLASISLEILSNLEKTCNYYYFYCG